MTSFGVADAVCSLVFGPLIKLFGRMPLFVFGAVINMLMIITLMVSVEKAIDNLRGDISKVAVVKKLCPNYFKTYHTPVFVVEKREFEVRFLIRLNHTEIRGYALQSIGQTSKSHNSKIIAPYEMVLLSLDSS